MKLGGETMLEIIGKVNTAICYAKVIEAEAVEQIQRMCDYEFTQGSKIQIMPDVHAGKGCTIGTTMTVHDKVVPNIVGVDIGCGMYTIDLEYTDIDLTNLRCYRYLKDTKCLERSLGTLRGENHFIEVDQAQDGRKYLVIHTGSRNLGKQVAEYYQSLVVELGKGKEALIAEYKDSGRRKEIQNALKQLTWTEKQADTPDDLCFLYGRYLEDYLYDVDICQKFATRNREKIAEILLDRTGMMGGAAFHTIHNYIDVMKPIYNFKAN